MSEDRHPHSGARHPRGWLATPYHHRVAMEVGEFWEIIETAASGARRCEDVAERVTQSLTSLGRETAEAFTDRFNEVMDHLYSWDLLGVAYILKSGCSDDGFEYFRCWVIWLGREMTERAISDPEGFGLMVDVGYENRLKRRNGVGRGRSPTAAARTELPPCATSR